MKRSVVRGGIAWSVFAGSEQPKESALPKRQHKRGVNPKPCRCCHGHEFSALEMTVKVTRTGEVVKRLVAVPGGFEVISEDEPG